MEEKRQKEQPQLSSELPIPSLNSDCSQPNTAGWEKPGREDAVLFGGSHSSSLAAGLLHKLLPTLHTAFCVSRSHSGTDY